MRVLITGAKGFIGKNLVCNLREKEDIEILEFDRSDNFELITKSLKNIDFIFHLAGINRPQNTDEFYSGNVDFTEKLINEINKQKLDIPILITSSIQASLDNDYGKSKRKAELLLEEYGKEHKVYIYRLHNVFGKWCKPNYNSVIATFCYNISHNEEIIVNDEHKVMELIYIDDVIHEFLNVLYTKTESCKENGICYVSPVYKKSLGYIANLIMSFKDNMNSITVPETGDEFIKKLFSTYLSYVELEDMVITPKMNIDERGSFTELIRTEKYGQVSVSVSKKGVFRGNHYHHTKMERFIVVKGIAKITFRHILTNVTKEYIVDESELKIVNIPVGYTHKIENIGEDEMILLLWCNELFDKNKPDTYFAEV